MISLLPAAWLWARKISRWRYLYQKKVRQMEAREKWILRKTLIQLQRQAPDLETGSEEIIVEGEIPGDAAPTEEALQADGTQMEEIDLA